MGVEREYKRVKERERKRPGFVIKASPWRALISATLQRVYYSNSNMNANSTEEYN